MRGTAKGCSGMEDLMRDMTFTPKKVKVTQANRTLR